MEAFSGKSVQYVCQWLEEEGLQRLVAIFEGELFKIYMHTIGHSVMNLFHGRSTVRLNASQPTRCNFHRTCINELLRHNKEVL